MCFENRVAILAISHLKLDARPQRYYLLKVTVQPSLFTSIFIFSHSLHHPPKATSPVPYKHSHVRLVITHHLQRWITSSNMWKAAVFEVHSLSSCQRITGNAETRGLVTACWLRVRNKSVLLHLVMYDNTTGTVRQYGRERHKGVNSAVGTAQIKQTHDSVTKHTKHHHWDGNVFIAVVQSSQQTSQYQTKVLFDKKTGLLQLKLCYITCKEWKQRHVSSHITNVLPFPQPSEKTHLQLHTNPTTSELTTTQPQLPSLVLSLQPQKPQPTSTMAPLIIHGGWKSIHPQTVLSVSLSVWGVELRFTWAHRCAQATDLLIVCSSPLQTTGILLRGPPISLFLIFLVFFPQPNHHYLDKLLTLPEKLNYINNSTVKILSPLWSMHGSQ